MYLVKLYMKSTNIIEFKCKDLTKTMNGLGMMLEENEIDEDEFIEEIEDVLKDNKEG